MKVKFALFIEKVTTYFWIIPSLIIFIILSILFLVTNTDIISTNEWLEDVLLVKASTDGARLILSAIATAVMTVVGVLFSIILVVLQQISSQYSPRVVSNFTRSSMAQSVLGSYIGTFMYCLVLLMSIGEKGLDPESIPQLALALSVVLAMICLILLVIYVHYVTKSIQSTDIIARVTKEALDSFRNVLKDQKDCHIECTLNEEKLLNECTIKAKKFGYIDSIDWKDFDEKLPERWEICFYRSPGDFVQEEMPILTIKSDQPLEEKVCDEIYELIDISPMRTNAQDPSYGIQKLSDIAIKSLSPSVNDPSTAIESIHSITAVALEQLRNYPLIQKVALSENKLIIFKRQDPSHLINFCYDQIIEFGKRNTPVIEQIRRDLEFMKENLSIKEVNDFIDGKLRGLSALRSL